MSIKGDLIIETIALLQDYFLGITLTLMHGDMNTTFETYLAKVWDIFYWGFSFNFAQNKTMCGVSLDDS